MATLLPERVNCTRSRMCAGMVHPLLRLARNAAPGQCIYMVCIRSLTLEKVCWLCRRMRDELWLLSSSAQTVNRNATGQPTILTGRRWACPGRITRSMHLLKSPCRLREPRLLSYGYRQRILSIMFIGCRIYGSIFFYSLKCFPICSMIFLGPPSVW